VSRPLVFLTAPLVAIVLAGCGGTDPVAGASDVDLKNGKAKFTSTCGGCHTLADAGSKGTIGPNLDAAYAGPASEDWERSSFEAMVKEQIRVGATSSDPPMPAELLKGQDAVDVAAYVAAAAASRPGE
jgi:mono/diheme cytochrome c family protein